MGRRGSLRYYSETYNFVKGSRIMESWSVSDVSDFLTSNNFDEEVVQVFRSNKITGKVLSLLSDEDFKELGLTALGDRRLLSHLLQQFAKVILLCCFKQYIRQVISIF